MKSWKLGVVSTAMAALLVGSTGSVWAAQVQSQPGENQSVDHQDGPHKHDAKHGKHKMTPQQKEALKKAGINPQVMRATRQEIHDTLRDIKASGDSLRVLMHKTTDEKLKEQVRSDLEPFRENMRQAHGLHIANRNLHDEFVAAVDAGDTAKIKSVFSKMEANQVQELKYVKAAQKAMHAVLKNMESKVKS